MIIDKPVLYFTSPFDTITLNVRSLNYNPTSQTLYRIILGNRLYSESTHGNNKFSYDVLEGNDSLLVKVQMVESTILKDQYIIVLRKRKFFNLLDHNKYLYSSYGLGRVIEKKDTIRIENISSNFQTPTYDNNIVIAKYPLVRDRKIRISGSLRNINLDNKENFCNLAIGGRWGSHGPERVGKDLGVADTTKFYKTSIEFNINDFFFNSSESMKYIYLPQELLISANNSICEGNNIVVEDITDLDNDGFIDFDDNCPLVYGTNKGCPQTSDLNGELNDKFSIYPNPISDIMVINSSYNGLVKVCDMNGTEIFTYTKSEAVQEFQISDIPNGIYILKLIGSNNNLTKKILIHNNY